MVLCIFYQLDMIERFAIEIDDTVSYPKLLKPFHQL